jgi:hypothetical protein
MKGQDINYEGYFSTGWDSKRSFSYSARFNTLLSLHATRCAFLAIVSALQPLSPGVPSSEITKTRGVWDGCWPGFGGEGEGGLEA